MGEDFKGEQGGYHFEVDAKDRTSRAYGQLRLVPTQRRSRSTQANAGKPDRQPKDHGGHYIGRQFGGPETRYNHFAQNARFNQSDYAKLENEWKAALKSGKRVKVDVRSRYDKNSKRPHHIRVFYTINGAPGRRSFPNK